MMAFDFPSNPNVGNTYSIAGITYVWDGVAWNVSLAPLAQATAQPRNYLVNGAFQIGQEFGTNVAWCAVGQYPADQWIIQGNIATFQGLKGGPNHIAVIVTTPDTAATTTEYAYVAQPIEGCAILDLNLGSANSKPLVIDFGANIPVAGTYWIALQTAGATHSWLGSYAISAAEAGQWVRKVVTVPAGVINAGTFSTDNTKSLSLVFTFHCGPTYVGVAGFQAGNKLAGPGQALGLSTASAINLSSVGLYRDPDATGKAPPFVMPDYYEELARCKRYWQRAGDGFNDVVSGPGPVTYRNHFVTTMRAPPTVTTTSDSIGNGTLQGLDTIADVGFRTWFQAAGAGACYFAGTWTANARM